MNKKIIAIVVVLLGVIVGIYVYAQKTAQKKTQNVASSQENATNTPETVKTTTTSTQNTASPTTVPKTQYTTGQYSSGEEITTNDVQVLSVVFDGKTFTPENLEINQNDWVFFKNTSAENFWPASAPHPTHTDYSAFDALKPYASGKSYKFQFTKKGTWKYHDHLQPEIVGVVVVK